MSEKAPEFVVKKNEAKAPWKLEFEELLADAAQYFSPKGQQIIQRWSMGENIPQQELTVFIQERNKWWQNKYGFPYERGKERHELLKRKYDMREAHTRADDLQSKLLLAVKKGNEEELEKIRAEYVREFPDQLEGVTALLEFSAHLESQKFMDAHSFSAKDPAIRAEMLERVEGATQYNFLLTDFIAQNMDNKSFLVNFWDALDHIAKEKGMLPKAHLLQRGVLSQVATFKIFDRLGMNPRLSHPKEDAFKSVDFWVEGGGAVQVKGSDKKKEELFVEADVIDFPGVETEDANGVKHVNTYLMHAIQKFSRKISAYEKEIRKPIKGYFAVIPYSEFDLITGEPSEAIVKRSAESLGVPYVGSAEEKTSA